MLDTASLGPICRIETDSVIINHLKQFIFQGLVTINFQMRNLDLFKYKLFFTIQLLCYKEDKNFENKREGGHRTLMLCLVTVPFKISFECSMSSKLKVFKQKICPGK